jgi:hypothetical protein
LTSAWATSWYPRDNGSGTATIATWAVCSGGS